MNVFLNTNSIEVMSLGLYLGVNMDFINTMK